MMSGGGVPGDLPAEAAVPAAAEEGEEGYPLASALLSIAMLVVPGALLVLSLRRRRRRQEGCCTALASALQRRCAAREDAQREVRRRRAGGGSPSALEASLLRLALASLSHERLGGGRPFQGRLKRLDMDVLAMVGSRVVGTRPCFTAAPPSVLLSGDGSVLTHVKDLQCTAVCAPVLVVAADRAQPSNFRVRFRVVHCAGYLAVGLVQRRSQRDSLGLATDTHLGWGWCARGGSLRHNSVASPWRAMEGFHAGDELELRLDVAPRQSEESSAEYDEEQGRVLSGGGGDDDDDDGDNGGSGGDSGGGTLRAFRNGRELGVIARGLVGSFRWMVETGNSGTVVRVGQ